MFVYKFQNCVLVYYPEVEYCETVFPDGAKCPASAQDNADYHLRARELGYGDDVVLMSLHHEVFHTLLAENRGEPYSQTLWSVAHDKDYPGAEEEESRVIEFQRKLMQHQRLLLEAKI